MHLKKAEVVIRMFDRGFLLMFGAFVGYLASMIAKHLVDLFEESIIYGKNKQQM